jgi:tRNA(Ile)-lysidine synthase
VIRGKVKNPADHRDFASLKAHFLATLNRHEMLRPGDRVGAAVSGGADSVALLLLLLELREKLGIVLSVVHFNHKLRGKASDADEKFVAKLAAKHGLAFHSASVYVAKKAKAERANLEDAARHARYDYFHSLVESGELARVAVGHTADDQAETVLAHLLRGTGLAGLGGIHPVVGPVIRPLLTARRAELRAYLRSKKQTWREDATNRDTTRLRARVRKKLLPLLEKQFQHAIVEHLETLAELAREDEAHLNQTAESLVFALAKKSRDAVRVPLSALADGRMEQRAHKKEGETDLEVTSLSPALQKRMVRLVVENIKPRAGQFGAKHVQTVLEFARCGKTGTSLELPGGVQVRRERDELVFCAMETAELDATRKKNAEYEYSIDFANGAEELPVPELECVFRFRVIDWPPNRAETSSEWAVLDRNRLRLPLVLRNWRPGDRLQPVGHRSAHKLKRLLNEKHVSRWDRDGWPVLTSGTDVVWARGFPVAAEYAANERTQAGVLIVEARS